MSYPLNGGSVLLKYSTIQLWLTRRGRGMRVIDEEFMVNLLIFTILITVYLDNTHL